MLDTPFPPWPSFTEEEADAVRRVLLSNRVNQWTGEHVLAFEREYAEHVGSRFALALANGTVALELALRGLGIGPGDEVVVPPRTFIATVSAVIAVGATPVFADVDRDTQALSGATVTAAITPRTRAVIVVHLGGLPANLDELCEVAAAHDIELIEDCAQAHGARWRDRSVGTFGRVGAWSFCQDKILSTGGEGGMVTTDDEALYRRMWAYKDHGKGYAATFEREHLPGFRWLHESFGSNFRMTEMQAVIGRIQLGRLPDWQRTRARNAARLRRCAERIDALRVPRVPEHATDAAYRCYLFVRSDDPTVTPGRDAALEALRELSVPAYVGGCGEVYREAAFDGAGSRPSEPLPVARELAATSIALLVHPTLDDEHIQRTETALSAVFADTAGTVLARAASQ